MTWRATVMRGIGQTLITLGVVVLLFVVYEVYVTDLFGAAEAGRGDQSAIDAGVGAAPTPRPRSPPWSDRRRPQ